MIVPRFSSEAAKSGRSRWRSIGITGALILVGTWVAVFGADAVVGRWFRFPLNDHLVANRHRTLETPYAKFTIRTNSDGFRERELPTKAFSGGTRVLVLGDSQTWGTFVEA